MAKSMGTSAGKIALVTGASSGIGLLSAVELARRGMTVVATMRNPERRGRLEDAARAAGVLERMDVRQLDVTDFDAIPGVFEKVAADHKRIDVLLNNAGFAVGGFAEDIQMSELRHQFETNFFGNVATTKAALPIMRRQRAGHILTVTSIGGRIGQPVVSSYTASKFALEGWTESLRLECAPLGIKVVLIEPGAFATDIWERNSELGANVTQADSPNYARAQRFQKEVIKQIPQADATEVATLIADAAEDPNPRLRYMIGKDAKIQWAMRTILPWKWYERILVNYLKLRD